MALHLVAATKTDTGREREQNEDVCLAQIAEESGRTRGLFIVADGMGGYHAGEVASRLAADTIRDSLRPMLGPVSAQPTVRLKRRKGWRGGAPAATEESSEAVTADNEKAVAATDDARSTTAEEASDGTEQEAEDSSNQTRRLTESIALEHYGDRLREAVEHSANVIYRYGRDHSDARGLGSTLTAVLIVDGRAYIANVGDSRTYLLRDGTLQRITRDHSLVARLVEEGQIGADAVYDHPHRNLVYRSLGAGRPDVEVDIFTEELKADDELLLCSDGLWEMVHDPDLLQILTEEHDLERACDQLIDLANAHGGEDNITAVLVRCEEG